MKRLLSMPALGLIVLASASVFAQEIALDELQNATKPPQKPRVAFKQNLIGIFAMAPLNCRGAYGGLFEHVYARPPLGGGAKSLGMAAFTAEQYEPAHFKLDDLKAEDLKAIGLFGRDYIDALPAGLYVQYGIAYISADEARAKKDNVEHRYELKGGEAQAGFGYKYFLFKSIALDINLTGRLEFGSLKRTDKNETSEDEILIGWNYALAGGLGFAF